MTAKLYCFGESGNAYKAALTMELAGYDWEPVYVDFFNGEARSAEYQALNEMAEAPVFVEGDLTLSQSCVIQLHIAEKTGKFLADDRQEMMRWLFWDAQKGSGQQGSLRFLMNFLPEAKRPQEAIAWLKGRVLTALKTLERHMEGREWIVGDRPSLADFACCGYLYYPEPFGFDRTEFPNLDRWLDGIAALPGWKHPYDLMPGNPSDRA
ncbi:MAG: glutathione S-transferase family protein [Thioclava marina]|jgi:Glutathione S-transferase|uniref:Glutathione S-transferase n=1 Tax=Thioclava marina TaxID=1915077 RepID=A0ABX3MP25_9RHOB|nr:MULTISPECIES: glutathione S-transferase family protein [Thioclava]MBC7146632.1 glutathione S-transferase family protein [Thioclava marina]MBD3803156.1 glutathione S-transferase family protein [Thioclava sp.]OOY11838.1 glutathione S-transferase [Thioclava marina]TNF15557.1 MAG: glutathione S-transferase family protein [Paracoccaceae bacterium]